MFTEDKPLRVFEAFAGIGSQRKALNNIGIPHKVVAISEIDKYALLSYEAIHGDCPNLGDISKLSEDEIPDHDLFTYSFPCQDISLAGRGRGFSEGSNTRSSLLWECKRVIGSKKPKYLLLENVKNIVGKKNIDNFNKWLDWLDGQGYYNYWQVLNAKDYGIPQNRERVFVVSIRKDVGVGYEFPKGFASNLRLKDFLDDEVDEKYYISQEKAEKIILDYKGDAPQVGWHIRSREFAATGWKDHCPTLCARDYKDPKNVILPCITPDRVKKRQNGRRFKTDGEPMFTITAQDRHGVLIKKSGQAFPLEFKENYVQWDSSGKNHNSQQDRAFYSDGICGTVPACNGGDKLNVIDTTNKCIQVHTLEGGKWDKMHDVSRRVYSDEGIAPTVHTCQGCNTEPKVMQHSGFMVKNATTKGYLIANEGDSIDFEQPSSNTRRGRVQKQMVGTLNTADHKAVVQNYRIRKLTPKECLLLMGFDSKDYELASKVCSNSQIYKQAGNSIVVPVLEHIFNQLFKGEF